MGIEQKENGNYVSSHEPFKEHSYEWQAQNARNDSYRNSSATPETKSPPLTPLTSNTGGHSAPVAMPLLLSATKFYFFFIVAIWLVSIPAFRSMTIMTDAYGWVCSGQLKLATALEFFQNNRSDSFGVRPPLY